MTKTNTATVAPQAPTTAAAPSVAVKPAKYPETAVITLTDKGKAGNPKRAASAKRYQLYLDAAKAGTPLTVGAYLDGCLALHADEPRYRWRADLTWDLQRGFITVGEAK